MKIDFTKWHKITLWRYEKEVMKASWIERVFGEEDIEYIRNVPETWWEYS